jgi:hypothetical protein
MSNGFDSVLIVVNHLAQMAYFMPCTQSVATEETPTLFFLGVYRLHGLPRVQVSYRNPKFVFGYSQALWRRLGTRLSMPSKRDPETCGITERVNMTFQQLRRCFCCYDGYKWAYLLPQVEFAYNASRAFGIEHTPFSAKFRVF